MNDIEQLNERINQLTELVKTGSEAIKNMKAALKAAEEEKDRLESQRREEPTFKRLQNREYYWSVGTTYVNEGEAATCRHCENFDRGDTNYFLNNNYFHTKQRAQEVADKMNFLLKLERLHDVFCPDYVPDWSDNKSKFYVFYNHRDKRYDIDTKIFVECKSNVFFPSGGIARKVCDILNEELKEEKI